MSLIPTELAKLLFDTTINIQWTVWTLKWKDILCRFSVIECSLDAADSQTPGNSDSMNKNSMPFEIIFDADEDTLP